MQIKASTSTTWFTFSALTLTNVNVTGLQASRTYQVRVRATCTGGIYTAYSPTYTFTTPAFLNDGGASPETPQATTEMHHVHLGEQTTETALMR